MQEANFRAHKNDSTTILGFIPIHSVLFQNPNGKFLAVPVIDVQSGQESGWRVYPTLLSPGRNLILEIPDRWIGQTVTCNIFDAAGRLIWQSNRTLPDLKQELILPAATWSKGIYFFVCTGKPGVFRQTFLVHGS